MTLHFQGTLKRGWVKCEVERLELDTGGWMTKWPYWRPIDNAQAIVPPEEFVIRELLEFNGTTDLDRLHWIEQGMEDPDDPGTFVRDKGDGVVLDDSDWWSVVDKAEVEHQVWQAIGLSRTVIAWLEGTDSDRAWDGIDPIHQLDYTQLHTMNQSFLDHWRSISRKASAAPGWAGRQFASRMSDVLSTERIVTHSDFSIYDELSHPGFLRAVCADLYNLMRDPLPWRLRAETGSPFRICANERCGRKFLRQRGTAKHGQHRTSSVMYCSYKCANATAQRKRRERAKGIT